MSLRIESPDGSHYAELTDTAEGVRITVWRAPRRQMAGRRIDVLIMDCPYHVALDGVHDIMMTVRRNME